MLNNFSFLISPPACRCCTQFHPTAPPLHFVPFTPNHPELLIPLKIPSLHCPLCEPPLECAEMPDYALLFLIASKMRQKGAGRTFSLFTLMPFTWFLCCAADRGPLDVTVQLLRYHPLCEGASCLPCVLALIFTRETESVSHSFICIFFILTSKRIDLKKSQPLFSNFRTYVTKVSNNKYHIHTTNQSRCFCFSAL